MRVVNPNAGSDSVKLYISYPYWDRANRDSTIAVKVGANIYTWQMLYYDTGPIKRILYPASTTLRERYVLNPRNFITTVMDSVGTHLRCRNIYTYNPIGDRSSDSLLLTNPDASTVVGKIRWNYDNIRRLNATRYPASISSGDSAIYGYDEMGNRTSRISSGNTTNYSYNLPDNKLLKLDDMLHTWSYDGDGNNTHRTDGSSEDNLTYDYESRLNKVWHHVFAIPPQYDSVSFEYDGLGQRRRKVGISDTTRYTWDGLYPVVEWNNQGKLKQTLVYANGLLLGIIDSTVTTNSRYLILHDGLGSSTAMTDNAATIDRSLIYSDFGQSLVDNSAAGIPTLNRLYAGYSWDGSPANFYWMKYRQTYDPTVGRFGQEDPSQLSFNCKKGMKGQNAPQVLNRYQYSINNPTTFTDPAGLKACCNYWLGFGGGMGFLKGVYYGTVSYYCWDDQCGQRKAGTLVFSCNCTWSFGAGGSASIGPMMQCNNSIEDLIPSYDSFERGFKTLDLFSWDKYRDISDLSLNYGPGLFFGECDCSYLHGITKDWGSK